MHRMAVVVLGGSSTGGALGSVVRSVLEVGAVPAMVALYAGAMLVGFGLFSTLMFGRPWPRKSEE